MNIDQVIQLLIEQQEKLDEKLDENIKDKSNPDYMYYLGMLSMVNFILMRIQHGS